MSDDPVFLDGRRGMAAQRATELRRLEVDVEADQDVLRVNRDAIEKSLLSEPATTWREAADKARYVLRLLAAHEAQGDTRVALLIAAVLADFDRLGEA